MHVGRQYSVKVVPLELIELGKTGHCIQKRVCAFMLLELIELKKYRGAFRAKGGGGQGTHTLLPLSRESRVLTGPDSIMVRAFASEAGGAGSNPGRVIPKTLKMVPVATLLRKDAVGVP